MKEKLLTLTVNDINESLNINNDKIYKMTKKWSKVCIWVGLVRIKLSVFSGCFWTENLVLSEKCEW
jgi:hypothetical protein